MERSAGIICLRSNNGVTEFLVCTPGGPQWTNRECWNFPKGHIEDGETPSVAAVREFEEETGIQLDRNLPIAYAGSVKQNSNKRVEVFIRPFGEDYLDDVEKMHSNLFVDPESGKEYPEIGKYAWMTYDGIASHGNSKAYLPLFKALTMLNDDAYGCDIDKWVQEHCENKMMEWVSIK